jgi:hypothetical protein
VVGDEHGDQVTAPEPLLDPVQEPADVMVDEGDLGVVGSSDS